MLDNLATVNVTGGSQARNHTYVYDATSKRLSQVKNTVGGAVVANLTYDVQGNLASKGPSGSVQTYQFDLGNRLRSVPNKETGYEYDGHGRRVYASTVGSSSILSQYANSGQVLYQENNKQSKRIDYIYLGNSLVAYRERPLASSTETLKYQHTDALGSPIAVTDAAKSAIETSEYEPFGQLVNKALFDGPGYTGHVQDAATGLTYMQQRYYDAGIGRFLSVDPVTAYSNPVGAFNRYWYANDNPYKFTDPDGRNALTKLVKLVLNKGDAAATFAGVASDVKTVMDSNASTGERIVAGISILSEAAPVSVSDFKDAAKGLKMVADKGKSYYSREKRVSAHARADGKCEYCGKPTQTEQPFKPDSAEGDHFTPQSQGGKTTDENLVNSCRECNGSGDKGAKMPGTEWEPKAPNERIQEKMKEL